MADGRGEGGGIDVGRLGGKREREEGEEEPEEVKGKSGPIFRTGLAPLIESIVELGYARITL